MTFTFTHPLWLLALVPALGWSFWFAWKSDASVTRVRKWISFAIRLVVVVVLVVGLPTKTLSPWQSLHVGADRSWPLVSAAKWTLCSYCASWLVGSGAPLSCLEPAIRVAFA